MKKHKWFRPGSFSFAVLVFLAIAQILTICLGAAKILLTVLPLFLGTQTSQLLFPCLSPIDMIFVTAFWELCRGFIPHLLDEMDEEDGW